MLFNVILPAMSKFVFIYVRFILRRMLDGQWIMNPKYFRSKQTELNPLNSEARITLKSSVRIPNRIQQSTITNLAKYQMCIYCFSRWYMLIATTGLRSVDLACLDICLEGLSKVTKKLTQHSRSPRWELNQGSLENKAGVLIVQQWLHCLHVYLQNGLFLSDFPTEITFHDSPTVMPPC